MRLVWLAAILVALIGCRPDDGAAEPVACERARIKKIYAVPGSLLLVRSTKVELETFDDVVEGDAEVTFAIRRDDDTQGIATLAPAAACADGSAACYEVTCVGTGESSELDAQSGLPSGPVRVEVEVDDDVCRDHGEVWIQCLQPSDEQTCNTCVRRVEPAAAAALGSACLGSEAGCADDEACSALWSCQEETLCSIPNVAACYCGELGDPEACRDPAFVPEGPCKNEALAAYEAQFLRKPQSNEELLEQLFNVIDAPAGFPSLAAANLLASQCLRPDDDPAPPTLRNLLLASDLSPEAAQTCIDACF